MPHILHISPSYAPAYIYGGPTLSVSRLCVAQAKLGAQVTVYTTTANGAEELDVPTGVPQLLEGVRVHYFKRWTKDHTHFSPSLLWRVWMDCKKYEAVHIHSWWNFVALFSVFMCWSRGVRPVLSTRGMISRYSFEHQHSKSKLWLHRLLGKWLLSKTVLHATSHQEAEEGLQIHPNWNYFVAPNLIQLPPLSMVRAAAQVPNDSLQFVSLARLHPVKGLDVTLRALSQVNFDWHLNIIGTGEAGYTNELKALAQQLNIHHRIEWCGWVSGQAKYEYLSQADLYLLTSHNENFANAVLEALAVGTPVLLSERVGMAHYVQQKGYGSVNPLKVEALAHALELIREEYEALFPDRRTMAEQVHRDFNPTTVAQQYLKAYQLPATALSSL